MVSVVETEAVQASVRVPDPVPPPSVQASCVTALAMLPLPS